MFDPDEITQDVIQQLNRHLARLVKTLLRDEANLARLEAENWDQVATGLSPLKDEIRLLTRVANGDFPGDLADENLIEDVESAIESVCSRLFRTPGNPRQLIIPSSFWDTSLGHVIRHCQVWLRGDDLITYTEAAQLLWPDDDLQAARMRIKRLVDRGVLSHYTDPRENNPQRNARVSRAEVLEQRDDSSDD
jgi:hypothetical protein